MTGLPEPGTLKVLLSGVGRAAKPLDRPFLLAYNRKKSECGAPVTAASMPKDRGAAYITQSPGGTSPDDQQGFLLEIHSSEHTVTLT